MTVALPRYAELQCVTNFSFLKGASHAEELVLRAVELGYAALAITDECSLAGVVRAHVEAKQHGLKLLIGSSFVLDDGLRLVVVALDREGYGNLSELITLGRMRCEKGTYRLTRADLDGSPQPAGRIPESAGTIDHLAGLPHCIVLWIAPRDASDEALDADAAWFASTFGPRERTPLDDATFDPRRAWIAIRRTQRMDDRLVAKRLLALGERTGLPCVATGDVHMHARSRKPLQDTMTAIRLGRPIADCGDALAPNAERHLRSRWRLSTLFDQALLEASVTIADQCHFSLAELGYEYPREIVPDGQTQTSWLRHLTEEGLVTRYPQGTPEKVRRQIENELALIAELRYEAFFLTVHDIVRYARSVGILCQGRGSAANSSVCFSLGITEVNPALQETLFERFLTKERNEPPDIDVDFEHQRREEVIQYVYDKYGRHRTALAATVIAYRTRSSIRDVGRALGLDPERIDRLSASHAFWEGGEEMRERLEENGFDPDSPLVHKLMTLTSTLRSFPRHLSQHVGGFVISRDKLSRMVPIENAAMERPKDWDEELGRRAVYADGAMHDSRAMHESGAVYESEAMHESEAMQESGAMDTSVAATGSGQDDETGGPNDAFASSGSDASGSNPPANETSPLDSPSFPRRREPSVVERDPNDAFASSGSDASGSNPPANETSPLDSPSFPRRREPSVVERDPNDAFASSGSDASGSNPPANETSPLDSPSFPRRREPSVVERDPNDAFASSGSDALAVRRSVLSESDGDASTHRMPIEVAATASTTDPLPRGACLVPHPATDSTPPGHRRSPRRPSSDEPALFPTFRSVIQWDKDDLEALGLLKVDVLALGMLSAVRRALDLCGQRRGRPFAMRDVPPEDPATYDMICKADTVGVFQIESRAQMSMLPRLRPRKFYDLVVEVAIVRPGPIQGGMVHPYLKAREAQRRGEAIRYPKPAVKEALERTLGVPIFQEQVMQLMMLSAKFTAGEADQLRRAMAAWKRKGGLGPFETRIVEGMVKEGYERGYAERIFRQVEGFGEYGFPESHAASFAFLVYVSCWIKCHEPAAFLAAMLNSQPLGFYSPSQLIQDAKRHGVEVRPIDVTVSEWDSTLEETDASSAIGDRFEVGEPGALADPQAPVDGRTFVGKRSSDDGGLPDIGGPLGQVGPIGDRPGIVDGGGIGDGTGIADGTEVAGGTGSADGTGIAEGTESADAKWGSRRVHGSSPEAPAERARSGPRTPGETKRLTKGDVPSTTTGARSTTSDLPSTTIDAVSTPIDAPSTTIDRHAQPAVRLGLNSVGGFNLHAARRVVAARKQRPFASIDDLGRRAALSTLELDALAAADALTTIAGHRRIARWQAAPHRLESDLMQTTAIDESQVELPLATEGQEIVEDYAATGFTLRRHPLALLRPRLKKMGLLSARELQDVPNGRYVRTTGIVTVRQRPGTAKGTIFITLEDETGVINVIVWSHVIAEQRRTMLTARLLTTMGVWQRQGEVRHVLANRFEDQSRLIGPLATMSRDFH